MLGVLCAVRVSFGGGGGLPRVTHALTRLVAHSKVHSKAQPAAYIGHVFRRHL